MFRHHLSRRLPMLLLCLLCEKGLLIAQDIDERNFIRYTQQDGLSHDVITSVTQDSAGYIWLSTFFGVNRFDGSRFVQMNNTNDSASMQPDYLRGMIWLDRRRLAVYSDGLHIFDTYTGKIQSLFIPSSDRKYQYKYNGVRCVQTDAAGDIFILTYSGFYHFDKQQRLLFRYDHYSKEPPSGTNYAFGRNIFWLDAHRLLILSIDGFYYYNIDKKEFRKLRPDDAPLLSGLKSTPDPAYLFFQQKPGCFLLINAAGDSIFHIDLGKGIRTTTE
ncbi:MAG TPA: two-component regulator propeller domain-containing protein, partial [Puia sp.]